jgi:hypothetical protein
MSVVCLRTLFLLTWNAKCDVNGVVIDLGVGAKCLRYGCRIYVWS